MLNELVLVLPVRGPFSLGDGWLLTLVKQSTLLPFSNTLLPKSSSWPAMLPATTRNVITFVHHMLTRSPYHPPSSSACHPQRRRIEQVYSLFLFTNGLDFLDTSRSPKVVFFPTFTKISFPRRPARAPRPAKSFRLFHALSVGGLLEMGGIA
jgi:hypothetical protein